MKRLGLILIITATCFSPLYPQGNSCQARAATNSINNASAISMAAWGVGLALGMAAIFLLLSSEAETFHAH